MKNRFVTLPAMLLAFTLLGAGGAMAEDPPEKFEFHIGDAFLASLNPAFSGGDRANASNGDTITIVGRGKFEVKEGGAKGSGIFVHQTPDGHLLGTGIWRAKNLLHFDDFGSQAGVPPTFHGGHAVIAVHVVGHPGGDATVTEEFDAVLTVDCKIGQFPAGFEEGITFEIPGLVNFDHKVFGATVFVAKEEEPEQQVEFKGTITSIDARAMSLAVAVGSETKTVLVGPDTRFEGQVRSFADLKVGDLVEVEGTLRPDGSILAREIEVEAPKDKD